MRAATRLALAFALCTAIAPRARAQSYGALYLDYGVPSSPAFELLPDKPDDVAHPTTPRDLAVRTASFIGGSRLKTGVALDFRPFATFAGSLRTYSGSMLRQIAWRSVLSMGTAPAPGKSGDALFGLGLRLPIIDGGDPRAHPDFIHDIENAYGTALAAMPQCPLHGNCPLPDADSATRSIRDAFFKNHWNDFRLDFGLAWLIRADSGALKTDSLSSDRVGIWAAAAMKLFPNTQLTIGARTARIAAHQRGAEQARHMAGARVRIFPASWVAVSFETARSMSRYRDSTLLNESWNHISVGLEFRVPLLNGWLGLGYGGDSSHRSNPGARFSFQYAYAKDRKFKQ